MWHTDMGIMKPDALNNLDAYWDKPFDVFDESYELDGIYHLPAEWIDRLGSSKQMDWGSWLYVCSYEKLRELFEVKPTVILQQVEVKKRVKTYTEIVEVDFLSLPKDRMYGILNVEDY